MTVKSTKYFSQDKENVLRQSKLLQGKGIYITEDITNKKYSTRKLSGGTAIKEEFTAEETRKVSKFFFSENLFSLF